MSSGDETEAALRDTFRAAGVRGWVHAHRVTSDTNRQPSEAGLDADHPVVMASLYKIVVLAAYCRGVDDGHLDPGEPVTLDPQRATAGPTGISGLHDPVTMSWRDLCTSMITVSDNAAADAVHRRIGAVRVQDVLRVLDLRATTVHGGTEEVHRTLLTDTATSDVHHAFRVLTDNDTPAEVRALNPVYGSATTPREMTRLLSALWRGELASPDQSAFARSVLARQVWPHRLRAGFPSAAAVAGKTGTLGAVRNEAAVVTFPGEHPVAVAVFTHAARAEAVLPRADAAIAAAGRTAVRDLRTPRVA